MSTYNPDLELTLDALVHLIGEKLAVNPKAGLILNKGKPTERRIRYAQLIENVAELHRHFSLKGNFTIGSCVYCKNYRPQYSSRYMSDGCPFFGKCEAISDYRHAWDTCKRFNRTEN